MKRLFWTTVGLGAGATAAILVGRWVRKQRRALAPSTLARQARGTARDVGALLGEAVTEFRRGMAEKESEVRAALAAD